MDEIAIEISNLSFSYSNKEVLKNLDFKVKKGEKVALMGKSGKGKSTLLRLIASYEKMQKSKGKIKINSDEIDKKLPNDIISYLPQDGNKALFPWKNVKENLYYPLSLRHDNLPDEMKKFVE